MLEQLSKGAMSKNKQKQPSAQKNQKIEHIHNFYCNKKQMVQPEPKVSPILKLALGKRAAMES